MEERSLQSAMWQKYTVRKKLIAEGRFVSLRGDGLVGDCLLSLGLTKSCLITARLDLTGLDIDYNITSIVPLRALSFAVDKISKKLSVNSTVGNKPTCEYQMCSCANQAKIWNRFVKNITSLSNVTDSYNNTFSGKSESTKQVSNEIDTPKPEEKIGTNDYPGLQKENVDTAKGDENLKDNDNQQPIKADDFVDGVQKDLDGSNACQTTGDCLQVSKFQEDPVSASTAENDVTAVSSEFDDQHALKVSSLVKRFQSHIQHSVRASKLIYEAPADQSELRDHKVIKNESKAVIYDTETQELQENNNSTTGCDNQFLKKVNRFTTLSEENRNTAKVKQPSRTSSSIVQALELKTEQLIKVNSCTSAGQGDRTHMPDKRTNGREAVNKVDNELGEGKKTCANSTVSGHGKQIENQQPKRANSFEVQALVHSNDLETQRLAKRLVDIAIVSGHTEERNGRDTSMSEIRNPSDAFVCKKFHDSLMETSAIIDEIGNENGQNTKNLQDGALVKLHIGADRNGAKPTTTGVGVLNHLRCSALDKPKSLSTNGRSPNDIRPSSDIAKMNKITTEKKQKKPGVFSRLLKVLLHA